MLKLMPTSNTMLLKGITLAASILAANARKITSRGGKGGYPSEIPSAITVDKATATDRGASITISTHDIGDDENVAITLAFELGSGLTGERRQRYLIAPKEGNKVLHFPWAEAKNIGEREGVSDIVDDAGNAFLPSVMHPGIRPNPFLQRALDESSVAMNEIIAEDIETLILPDLPDFEVVE
jgi:hypothetical protein